jgi:branched-subunit amino acid transport protein AzlD
VKLTVLQTIIIILAITLGTQISRWLPFIAFSGKKETPKFVKYLGRVLPPALMGLICVYCFKGTQILTGSHGLPELIATIVVIATYQWKENLLVSVGGGTLVYMLLVQFVF